MQYYVKVWEDAGNGVFGTVKGEVRSIKAGSFHCNSSNGSAGKYKFGNVCSSYCEFDYYADDPVTINVGDIFDWRYDVTVDKEFNDLGGGTVTATDANNDGNVVLAGFTATDDGSENITLSGLSATDDGNANITISSSSASSRTITSGAYNYFVVSVKKNRNLIHVIGYDAVYFLNRDYSQRLAQIESSFPMSIKDLYEDVCDYCGVGYGTLESFYDAKVNYFYVDGITGREMIKAIAEALAFDVLAGNGPNQGVLSAKYIRATQAIGGSGNYATGWNNSKTYVICPGDGTYYQPDGVTVATNVWYKERSLNLGDAETAYDGVEYLTSNGKSLGHYYSAVSPQNIYYIQGNIILDNIVESTMPQTFNAYAEDLLEPPGTLSGINDVFPYANTSVDIFPFRNPLWANMSTRIVDTNGNYYNLPIMYIDVTDERVHIEAYGSEVGADDLWMPTGTPAATAYPVWITYELHDGTYGKMTMAVNRKAGVAIVMWRGNGTAPPSSTKVSVSIEPYKSSLLYLSAPLRRGDRIIVADSSDVSDGTDVTVALTTDTYSGGELVIPLDQS